MTAMVKPLVVGSLIVAALAAIIGLGLNAVDASGAVGGIAFMLGAGISGLIGGSISRRMPPRRPHH
jgi:hypothetical protein